MSRAGDAVAPPTSVEGIDASWMTEALRVEHPDVEVTHLHHGQVRHGSESTVRVLLNYNRAGHEARLPPTMYVKGQWTPRQMERGLVGGLSSEARFYQDVAPLLPGLDIPACHFASVAADGRSAIVLEDLYARNVVMGSAGDSFKPETAYLVADQFAQLHALWYDAPELREVDWLAAKARHFDVDRMAEEETDIFGSFKDWWWDKRTHFPHNEFLPPELLDRQLVKRALVNKYRLEDEQPKCLIHGDPHLGNMYFDHEGRPGIYDWSPTVGRWGNDLNYAIVGSLEVDDRREHEQPILRHYLERLVAHGGPDIPWDDAWLAWRRQTIHGFMYMLCSPNQQPEELIAVQTIRFGWEAIDNDMLDALGV